MSVLCEAIYENGVLRPLTTPGLREGEKVEILVVSRPDASPHTPSESATILARIAELPLQEDDRGFSGREHDRILYGEQPLK